MRTKLVLLALTAALSLSAHTVFADHQAGHESEDDHHAMADSNNDGKISYDEFRASREQHMEKHFKKMDANGDGFIDQDEKKACKEKMKKRFDRRKDRREDRANSSK